MPSAVRERSPTGRRERNRAGSRRAAWLGRSLTRSLPAPMLPAVARVLRSAWWATAVGLLVSAAGLVVLFAQAQSEVLADPGLSLVDGYWIGRLPWTAVGVDLTIIGATIAVVFGTLTAWLAGGLIRRVVTALALAVAAFWWFLAMLPPPQGGFCASCPAPGPEPITMAYSQPQNAAIFLRHPAAIAGAVALSAPRSRRSAIASAAPVG